MEPHDYSIQRLYEVNGFLDKHGNPTNNRKEMAVMIARELMPDHVGAAMPFSMNIIKACKLKKGQRFIENISYERL